jgi:hypothetical protein
MIDVDILVEFGGWLGRADDMLFQAEREICASKSYAADHGELANASSTEWPTNLAFPD